MKRNKNFLKISFFTIVIILATRVSSMASTPHEKDLIQVPVEIIIDKIRGGLLGQMLGNLNGIPHEMTYIHEPGNVQNYIPSLPNGAWTDDDTDFEWVYILEMQNKGKILLSDEEIFSLWKDKINQRIWSSNRYARYLMDLDIKPSLTGNALLNPWAEFNVSGQFLCETFGLIAPAMPQTAAKIGLNYTTVAISGEPAQTTQLFTTMISHAFIENDINKVLDAGIASLDPASNTIKIINDVKNWHGQYPNNWKETRRLIKEKYTQEGGKVRDMNGTELNTGAIIAALLYGKGDFAETLKLAFNLGWDADCNAATVGTILGVISGYREMLSEKKIGPEGNKTLDGWMIVDRYRNTTRDNMPMDETITSFADRLINLFEIVNEENGGKKSVVNHIPVYEIPLEKPAPLISISNKDDQKQLLKIQYEKEILNSLTNGNREEKARAAYLAISLGMDQNLKEKHSIQWKEAAYDLSGYWKIMNNIFYGGDFKELDKVREKFIKAGFQPPVKKNSDIELYTDSQVWKDPKNLY